MGIFGQYSFRYFLSDYCSIWTLLRVRETQKKDDKAGKEGELCPGLPPELQ